MYDPAYKDHSIEPEKVAFTSSFPVYATFTNGENDIALYRQWFVI